MKRSIALVWLALMASALFASSSSAQTTSGVLVGVIKDSSGALVANAQVTAKNEATGVTYTGVANASGEYRIPNLPEGLYDLTTASTGFQSSTKKSVLVDANKIQTQDAILAVGANATVEVTYAAAVSIDTTTAQIQSTFDTKELQDLPTATVGLGALNLTLLDPGVASTGGLGAGTGPSVSGQRPRNNNFTIEGVDNNSKSVTGPLVYVPNDAVGEFTVLQNVFSAEYGHSTGGQFNQLVVSGTNSVHGRAYEYFQNRNLNAVDAQQAIGNVASGVAAGFKPRYDFNRYGAQLGGPVLKNKLFLFSNYERQTTGQVGSSVAFCAPTAAGLATIAAQPGLSKTNLAVYQKYTPLAATQATASDAICNPTIAVGSANIPDGDVSLSLGSFSNYDFSTSSLDFTPTAKDNIRIRYVYNRTDGLDTAATFPSFFTSSPGRVHLAAVNYIHTFTPAVSNEFRVGFNRLFSQTVTGGTFPGLAQFPNLVFDDLGGVNLGPDPNGPQGTVENLYQVSDAVNWTKGKHTLKFGIEGRKAIAPQLFVQRLRGDYEYSTLGTYLQDLSPDVFGQRNTTPVGVSPTFYGDQVNVYAYANDDWRATPTFTLNLGLRYEYTSVPFGSKEQSLNSAASVPGVIVFNQPTSQKKNFAPRIGFAYAPNSDTSIRAGFGLGYDVLYDNIGTTTAPPQFQTTLNVDTTKSTTGFLASGGLPANSSFTTLAAQRAATTSFVPNQKLPYSEQWTLSVEHVFAKVYTAEVRYVGTRGVHLDLQDRLNVQARVNASNSLATAFGGSTTVAGSTTLAALTAATPLILPAFTAAGLTGQIVSDLPYGGSNYNGLQTQLTRRFQGGLLVNAAYTYSKTMDDSTADFNTTALTPRRVQDFQNIRNDYARSALDRTHRLTVETVYDLPFFKNSNFLIKNLVGNLEFVPVYTFQSPEYTTVQSGVDSNLNGDSASDRVVVNTAGVRGTGSGVIAIVNPALQQSACGSTTKYNAANGANGLLYTACSGDTIGYAEGSLKAGATPIANAFIGSNAYYVQAGTGVNPVTSRNTLPTARENNFDLSAFKRVSFRERYKVEVGVQAFNVMNHSQYLPGSINEVNSIGSSSATTRLFDQVALSSGAPNPKFNQPKLVFSNNPRSLQLSGKVTF